MNEFPLQAGQLITISGGTSDATWRGWTIWLSDSRISVIHVVAGCDGVLNAVALPRHLRAIIHQTQSLDEERTINRDSLSELLRLHVTRGIGLLTARRQLNGIGDLLELSL